MLPSQSIQELLLAPVGASIAADCILGQCLQGRCADLFRFVVEHLTYRAYEMAICALKPQQNAFLVDHRRLARRLWQKKPAQHKVVAISSGGACKNPRLPIPSLRRQFRTRASQGSGCSFETYSIGRIDQAKYRISGHRPLRTRGAGQHREKEKIAKKAGDISYKTVSLTGNSGQSSR